MATKKATTTKKTTAPKKATTTKKTTATKTTTTKAAPKKTTTVKKTAPKKTQRITVDTNTSVGVRVFIVFLGLLAAVAFNMPVGKIGEVLVTGRDIFEFSVNAELATSLMHQILAIIAPVGLFEISTILLIVKSDKFMSFMAVMIDTVALVLLLSFMSTVSPVAIGWLLILFSIVVGIIFEITSFIISKK